MAADAADATSRIAELERQVTRLQEELVYCRAALQVIPGSAVFVVDRELRYRAVGGEGLAALGVPADAYLGRPVTDVAAAEALANFLPLYRAALAGQPSSGEYEFEGRIYETRITPLYDGSSIIGLVAYSRDITDAHHADQSRIAMQEELIAAQQLALRELGTPLIPVADDVVVMPLIGTLDSNRAQQVIETLLEGVSQRGASTAIIDITGVPVVDTQVANGLLRAAQAVKLLGARVVLTGIRPEVAQTLVGLGADLSGIVTVADLQRGIAFVLNRVRK